MGTKSNDTSEGLTSVTTVGIHGNYKANVKLPFFLPLIPILNIIV